MKLENTLTDTISSQVHNACKRCTYGYVWL